MAKYLKVFKNKGWNYWWLVEAHRERDKVVQKKLKYWGVHKPGEYYVDLLMTLDDDRTLDDLWLIWQIDNGRWRSQSWPGFTYCIKHEQEEWYWKFLSRALEKLDNNGIKKIWLTRASNRSEAIKNAKGRVSRCPEAAEVLETMTNVRHYPALVFDLSYLLNKFRDGEANGKR